MLSPALPKTFECETDASQVLFPNECIKQHAGNMCSHAGMHTHASACDHMCSHASFANTTRGETTQGATVQVGYCPANMALTTAEAEPNFLPILLMCIPGDGARDTCVTLPLQLLIRRIHPRLPQDVVELIHAVVFIETEVWQRSLLRAWFHVSDP